MPSSKPPKLAAAGLSRVGGRARREPWSADARPQLGGRPSYSTEEGSGSVPGRRAPRGLGTLGRTREPAGVHRKFRIIVQPGEDGVFVATVPSLPGCVSQGSTRDEALLDVREAIEGYVESLRTRNEPIPPSIHEEVIDVAV